MKKLAPAQAKQFEALLERFRVEVLSGPDGGLRNRWIKFEPTLPGELHKMNLKPTTVSVFKEAFESGFVAGLFQVRV